MKNVKRLSKPQSLSKNGAKWGRELLSEIAKHGDIEKVPGKFFNHYQKPDIKETLIKMYDGLCCYCETNVGLAEFGNIEHRKPKKVFPKSTYEWDNLHLSCTACNEKKGSKYNKKYPILDAVKDTPVSAHLKYDYGELGVIYTNKTPRGNTTIKHVDLNRKDLRYARMLVFLRALKLKKELEKRSKNPRIKVINQQLHILQQEAFGSVTKYVMTTDI